MSKTHENWNKLIVMVAGALADGIGELTGASRRELWDGYCTVAGQAIQTFASENQDILALDEYGDLIGRTSPDQEPVQPRDVRTTVGPIYLSRD